MKQKEKLDQLIRKILKEEQDSRSKGVFDMEISEELLRYLSDFRFTDDPIELTTLNLKKVGNGKYRAMLQAKTPEFKEFKKKLPKMLSYIPGDLEDEYDEIMKNLDKAEVEGSVQLIKQGRKDGIKEETGKEKDEVEQNVTKLGILGNENDIAKMIKDEIKALKEMNDNPLKPMSKEEIEAEIQKLIGSSNPADQKRVGELTAKLMHMSKSSNDEATVVKVTRTGSPETPQDKDTSMLKAGDKVIYTQQGKKIQETSKQPELQEGPCGACISGQLSELMDKLKALGEAAKDPKHGKLAEKTMRHLDAAKTALEAVVAHETMLEEKEQQLHLKEAEKHLKGIRGKVSKMIKNEAIVERIMKKMNANNIIAMKKKKGGELDEEKVANAMLKVALNESFIQKKDIITENTEKNFKEDLAKFKTGIRNFHESLKKAGFDVD
jgi:hypothetical protein